jgi:hypothetical protein
MPLTSIKYLIIATVLCYGCQTARVAKPSQTTVITLTSHKTLPNKPVVATEPNPIVVKLTKPTPKITTKKIAATAPATATVIWVNDEVAKKNFDGRLYYDLEGKRYWKNYVDGKYYLYNKNMYNNAAFKPR